MRRIIYYVAISIDGYICRLDHSITGFAEDSNAITKYLEDLQDFDTVIMGRKTYEFGYRYGLQPGQPAYPHMNHYIFSRTLYFENPHPNVHICPPDLKTITTLKEQGGTDIYLCGGGELAGWLLENEQVDILKLKLNPILLGAGIKLFGGSKRDIKLELTDTHQFTKGVQIMTYKILQ